MEKICDEMRREGTRLLTLTGVGGTGKTTLAHAVAGQLLREFPDGVFFVELAAIKQADLVASTIAQPLGVKEADGKAIVEALKDYMRGRKMLLVLDNFEHLLAAAFDPRGSAGRSAATKDAGNEPCAAALKPGARVHGPAALRSLKISCKSLPPNWRVMKR